MVLEQSQLKWNRAPQTCIHTDNAADSFPLLLHLFFLKGMARQILHFWPLWCGGSGEQVLRGLELVGWAVVTPAVTTRCRCPSTTPCIAWLQESKAQRLAACALLWCGRGRRRIPALCIRLPASFVATHLLWTIVFSGLHASSWKQNPPAL